MKFNTIAIAATACFLIFATVRFANAAADTGTTTPAPSSAAQELTSDALYQVAPGDLLDISVLGFDELASQPTVTPDGMISVALIGPQKVSGMTTDQITAMLVKKWSKYVINPPVTVAVKQKHEQLISVYGWVTHPGTAEYTPNLHVLQAIALVGGTMPDGDLRKVTITHRDGTSETVDLSNPATKGGTPADVVLDEEDNVFVPQNLDKFEVSGSVQNPGSYDFKPGTKVLDAITAAGGVTMSTADLQHATILHNGVASTVDLTSLINGGDQKENIPLAPGDNVTIPIVQFREYVFGDVQRPGYVDYKPGDRIIDALNNAGLNGDAQLWKVNVIRQDKTTNVAKLQVVNVESFLLKGKAEGNPAIEPGDVLYVPESRKPFALQDMIGVLSSINVLNIGTKIVSGSYLTAH